MTDKFQLLECTHDGSCASCHENKRFISLSLSLCLSPPPPPPPPPPLPPSLSPPSLSLALCLSLSLCMPNPSTERTRGTHRSPLSIAPFKGHSRVCSLLLEAGASVNHANGINQGPALMRIAVTRGHQEVALVLVERGASDNTLAPPMMTTLYKWTAEALKENKTRVIIAENKKQMEEMVQGIPEWCAQAASSVAAEGQNDGSGSICAAAQPLQPAGAGRKRKAPSTAE